MKGKKFVLPVLFSIALTGCATSGIYDTDTAHVPEGGELNYGLGVGGYWYNICLIATDCDTYIVQGKSVKATVDGESGNGTLSVGANAEIGAESVKRNAAKELWTLRLGGYPYVKLGTRVSLGTVAVKVFGGVGGNFWWNGKGFDAMDETNVEAGMRLMLSRGDWTTAFTLGIPDFAGLGLSWRFLYGGIVWRGIGAYGYVGVVLR